MIGTMRRMLLLILMLMVSVPAIADRTFSWEPADTATSYTMYYAGPSSGGQTGSIPADISGDGRVLYILDTSGFVGDYDFYVTASNQDGESNPSNTVTENFGPPIMSQTLVVE